MANNNDNPKWVKELAYAVKISLDEAREDRKQATEDRKEFARRAQEDRAEAERDRKEITYLIGLTGKVIEKIFGKLTDIADTNHEILLALKGNGRRNNGNRGNGNGRRK